MRTCKLQSRKSKVERDEVARPFAGGSLGDFLDSLPDILAARDLRSVAAHILDARKKGGLSSSGWGRIP